MSIFHPIAAPFVRYASFVNNVGPTIDEDFLNGTQDALAAILGAAWGRSFTMDGDDFCERLMPAGMFGGMTILTNTNGAGTMNKYPQGATAQGEHGVWGVIANNAAAYDWLSEDHQIGIYALDFIVSAKVKVTTRASLGTRANEGFHIGLSPRATNYPAFVVGSNAPGNWHTWAGGVETNTLVPVVDGQWYDLQIERTGGTVKYYIDGVLVVTQVYAANLAAARRYLRSTSPGAAIGNGFMIDYFKLGAQR